MLKQGDVFGKYRILSLLGRGGAGSVYVAEDETLGREVALKVLDRLLTRSGDFEAALRREARVVASIEHPHIVRIHALERVGDELAIDMAYMRGGSLATALHEGRVSTPRAVTAVQEVLSALACCHASGVVHRDVKPANILLDEHGGAQLSDFGLAKLLSARHNEAISSSVSTEFFVGTPRYAPPEAWDEEEPTPAWDVYSVGMVLYEAIAGRTAYDARSPLSYVKQFAERPAPRLDPGEAGISLELSELVAAMLEHEPENRPRSAAEAYELLRMLPESADIDEEPTLAPHAPFSVSLQRRRYRTGLKAFGRKLAYGGIVVAGMVLLVAALTKMAALPWESHTDDGSVAAFDVLAVDSADTKSGHMLVFAANTQETSSLVHASDTGFWWLQGDVTNDESVRYEGFWAEYVDSSARMFRHGLVKGRGTKGADGNEVLSLEFVNRQDGSRSLRSVLKTAAGNDPRASLRALSMDEYLQPLVYGELIPRRLEWAKRLEQLCFLKKEGLVTVPGFETTSITIDGVLDEPVWTESRLGATGHVPSPVNPSARLLLCYDKEAFYVGLQLERGEARTRTALNILNQFSVPFSSSPRWVTEFEDGRLSRANHIHATHEEPWTCEWESTAVRATTGKGWGMEVRIPFMSIDEVAQPEVERRWRLVCSVVDATSQQVLARWGEDDDRLETGMLIAFGATRTP